MNDIGLIGLGVMGTSLAENVARSGYSISVYNHTPERTEKFMDKMGEGKSIKPFFDMKLFADSLKRPRKIILMTAAGSPVDEMIDQLLFIVEKGDLIIDGGNSYFQDTIRRFESLDKKGILFLGAGISGGEAGALHGPSIMPGGTHEAYKLVEDIFTSIAADSKYGPCCRYMGESACGHFVKMLHNGIEYGMMQAIAETYHILKSPLGLDSSEISKIFKRWDDTSMNSYLMEISAKIADFKDEGNKPIVDIILDKAGQKGTGKWTVQTAIDLGIPAPSLTAALEARVISFFKEDRVKLSKKIKKQEYKNESDIEAVIDDLENALLFTNLILFSQGLWVISEASKVYGFDVDLSDVIKVWSNGCIIRTSMLDDIIKILERDPQNVYLLNDQQTIDYLCSKINKAKRSADIARAGNIPTPVINASIDYFFSMMQEVLPANFIQAQRDFFGAHTYMRTDKEGIFHTVWE